MVPPDASDAALMSEYGFTPAVCDYCGRYDEDGASSHKTCKGCGAKRKKPFGMFMGYWAHIKDHKKAFESTLYMRCSY